MKRYYIDTNCLLFYITDRNTSQQNRIAPYFHGASRLKHKIILTQNVITEFVYVCTSIYKIESAKVREMILDFVHTPGMEMDHSFPTTVFFHLWPEYIEDYGDAVLAASVQTAKGALLTFDRKLKDSCAKLNIPAGDL